MAMPYYAHITILYDIRGRQSYILSEEKQEEIVLRSPFVDFSEVAEYCQKNKKQDKTWSQKEKKLVDAKAIEGKEIIYSLPNEWYYDFKSGAISEEDLHARITELSEKTLATDKTKKTGEYPLYQYAAHFNKKGDPKKDKDGNPTGECYSVDNFNLHIIFPLRTKKKDKGVYSRNIYMAADGNGSTSVKSKAHILPTGEPMILHRKGESKGDFSPNDPEYNSKVWYQKKREEIKSYMQDSYDIEFGREYVYFHQYKHGKGSEAPKIKRKNKLLLEADILVEEFQNKGYVFPPRSINAGNNPAFIAFLNEVTEEEEDKNMRAIVEKYGTPPAPAAAKVTPVQEIGLSEEDKPETENLINISPQKTKNKYSTVVECFRSIGATISEKDFSWMDRYEQERMDKSRKKSLLPEDTEPKSEKPKSILPQKTETKNSVLSEIHKKVGITVTDDENSMEKKLVQGIIGQSQKKQQETEPAQKSGATIETPANPTPAKEPVYNPQELVPQIQPEIKSDVAEPEAASVSPTNNKSLEVASGILNDPKYSAMLDEKIAKIRAEQSERMKRYSTSMESASADSLTDKKKERESTGLQP